MRLQPIWGTIGDPHHEKVKADLKEKYGQLSVAHVAEGEYGYSMSYGRKNWTGVLKKDVEIDELGLAMMCDGGYNYFGGHSVIYNHEDGKRTFDVEIWFD